MTFAKMQELLKTVTYKAGWKFRIYEDTSIEAHFSKRGHPDIQPCEMAPDFVLEIQWMVTDIHTGVIMPLFWRHSIDSCAAAYMNEELFFDHVENAVMSIEMHEMHEWLKIRGTVMRDPHPELKNDPRRKVQAVR